MYSNHAFVRVASGGIATTASPGEVLGSTFHCHYHYYFVLQSSFAAFFRAFLPESRCLPV